MKIVKVRISRPVMAQFFIEGQGKCFGVHKGLPADAELTRFQYEQASGTYIATLKSDELDDVPEGTSVPFVDVEYMAYQIAPKAEKAEEPEEHKIGAEVVVH